jgi:predicted Ser/Thr protein kinase
MMGQVTQARPMVPQTQDSPAVPLELDLEVDLKQPQPPEPPAKPKTGAKGVALSETMASPSAEKAKPPSGPNAGPRGPTPNPTISRPESLVGQMVGSFKLVRVLGKGGMGAVYLGEHPGIGSRVAIKLLHPFLASRPELVRRFYDEARAVNLIGHENIVSIFDLNQLPGNRYYIVMEYLEGKTLGQLLNEGPVSIEVATDMLLQLTDALSKAHARAVVHRDLKPDNVFITQRGAREHFVKLVDFGIAKLRDEHSVTSQTAMGVLVGTPEYMSPEQADNNPVDARSDVYSLGVIAYRLVAGRLPFDEKTLGKLIVAHLERPPPPPRKFNPQLPEPYEQAILRALAKKPQDRFQDMNSFGRALLDAMRSPQPASMAPSLTPAPLPAPINPPVTAAEQPRVVAGFDVRLVQPPGPILRAADVSRGGLFLCTAAALPPLFSRVRLGLPRVGGGQLELAAEVVRHVSAAEAHAWNMEPGFGVQFVELKPADREALDRLMAQRPAAAEAPGVPAPERATDPEVADLLSYFSARFSANHYDLLGLSADAASAAISPAARTLEGRLRKAMEKAPPEHAEPLKAGLDRVRAALEALSTPARRVDYDAHRGNYKGVARALEAGFPLAELTLRHGQFLQQRPGLEARSQQQLGRIRLAKNRGNHPAALREVEASLSQDPLHPELQRAYAELLKLTGPRNPTKT